MRFVPERLKDARGESIRPETLADAVGVSTRTLANWEAGNTFPDVTQLLAIANFTGKSVDFFLEAA
jgi:transcriptional regulator with XRE-family HTH domain